MSDSTVQMARVADIPQLWARRTPESAALWEGGVAITFLDLQLMIDRGVALLRERGVVAGDRVAIVAENSVAEVAFFFAASWLRAWPVIVNARMSYREIETICGHCQPRVEVFVTGSSVDAGRHATRRGGVECSEKGLGRFAFGPTAADTLAEGSALADRVATLIYTSGTTGAPKGVMVTHAGLVHFCGVSAAARCLRQADIVYAALPLSHIFGIATILLSTLYAGASCFLEPRFTPEGTMEALSRSNVSVLQGVPTLFTRILAHMRERLDRPAFPKLRYLYVGGGALDPALKQQIEAAFAMPLHHGYGMTEYAGSMFVTRLERPRQDCSPGELNPGCEVQIVASAESPPGAGEIWVRGPGTMLGYYRAPELTHETVTAEGWLRTGDIGRLEAGALFIVGRSKDMIKRLGFAIYPHEIEAELSSHPAVRLAAVIGVPSKDCGEEDIVAFVEAQPNQTVDPAELLAYVSPRLAAYKRPTQVIPVQSIPLTANGKVRKQELRAMLMPPAKRNHP